MIIKNATMQLIPSILEVSWREEMCDKYQNFLVSYRYMPAVQINGMNELIQHRDLVSTRAPNGTTTE